MRPPRLTFLALVALSVLPAPGLAMPRTSGTVAPRSGPILPLPHVFDLERRFDANDLDLWTTNFGWLAYDPSAANSGLEFPRGSGGFAIFASGLWVGAQVAGEKRVTLAEYSSEWAPGRILGGVHEPVDGPGLQSWKVVPIGALATSADTGLAASPFGDPVRHHGWSSYVAEGGGVGAPVGTRRLPASAPPPDSVDVPGPALPGQLALWSVFNDADPANHTNDAGFSTPLGLEVRQSVFGFPSLPGVAFVRWTLVHRGSAPLDSAYVGFWCDPDVGSATDDKVAWNGWHGLGYAYNAQDVDPVYGATPPATGILYLGGPAGIPIAAFSSYVNGTDPSNVVESYRGLQGLDRFGNEFIDPTSGFPTRFVYAGDPVTSVGWIDPVAADHRMTVSIGPFSLTPGASATFEFAILAAQGANRLQSVQRLLCTATSARAAYNQDFLPPFASPGAECTFSTAFCPVPASTWAALCADPSALPPSSLSSLATLVYSGTKSIVPVPPLDEAFCAAVSVNDAASPRARAERELLALLANLRSLHLSGIVSPDGDPIGLSGNEPVACAWSDATTVAELAARAPDEVPLQASYVRVDSNPRDFQPVDWGGEAYGGAIGFGSTFFGSTLDPAAHRDSFPEVEIRFDATSTQRAYRYLRLQQIDGTPPAVGRVYRYAGFHPVPLEAIDVGTGERLELAFVERAVTDATGTLLPAAFQPPTLDATWGPNSESDGSREYLFVLRRPGGALPRPEMEVDGAVLGDPGPSPPVLYSAWLRRLEEGDEPEPGERIEVLPFQTPPSSAADARLLALAAQPQDDPAVLAAYGEITQCLAAINAGFGLGIDCAGTTPVAISLEEAAAEEGAVRLSWYVTGPDSGPFDLARRREETAPWGVRARLSVDGTRRVRYEDTDIVAGDRWHYGLFDPNAPGQPLDVVTVTVPGVPAFALRVLGAGTGETPTLVFSLPARGAAHFEVFDAAGRRRASVPLGVLEAGPHVHPWPEAMRNHSGLYFVRLAFGGRSVFARAVNLR